MARTCTICKHNQRDAIERALIAGQPYRNIAERFAVSATALHRHKARDLSMGLLRAAESQEMAHDADLLDQVKDLIGRAQSILAKAEEQGDHRTALIAIREVRETLGLWGKATGRLNSPPPDFPRQPLFNLPAGSQVAVAIKLPEVHEIGS